MTVGVLITDGGPHPAENWADTTAKMIVDIADHVSGEKRALAVKLQAAIIDVLLGHHSTVQNAERTMLASGDHDRLTAPLDPMEHVSLDDAVAGVIAATKGTPWEPDFATDEMKVGLAHLLGSHFSSNMLVERGWHADRNPHLQQAQAFRATFHPEA